MNDRIAGGEEGVADIAETRDAVCAASDFVADCLEREPLFQDCVRASGMKRLQGALALPAAENIAEEGAYMAALRRWRRAEFARIAWRDLAGWADLDETLESLSAAADAAIVAVEEYCRRSLVARHGRPRSAAGGEQRLIVLAMGKLGGRELNFSSDIDLILLYPERGDTDGAVAISNEEFFAREAQMLVRLLDTRTPEGFVFRVDLRLRPFGSSGPVVMSAAGLEDYLPAHGLDWERYAWVKARAVTNLEAYRALKRDLVRPFVYRRYLDFGLFESLRSVKSKIERDVRRRGHEDNVKLGDGGIREIEFIVQSFQLVRGGLDERLQGTSLRPVLARLAGGKLLPATAVAELDAAYVFLRRLENRLQMRADQQVHRLPLDPEERVRVAASMGFGDWEALRAAFDVHRRAVSGHFRAVVVGDSDVAAPAQELRLGPEDDDEISLREPLAGLGFADEAAAATLLQHFGQAITRRLDPGGTERLAALLPLLLAEIARSPDPIDILRRVLRVIEAIGRRSAYLALLRHDARARGRLIALAAHGDPLMDQIAAYPLLIDELLDDRLLVEPPDRATLALELERRLASVDPADEERVLDALRHFRRAAVFRLAIADLLGHLPIMRVSDRLTDVAELLIESALELTAQHLAPQLGTPHCGDGSARRPVALAVVGYGKLGGMELGYASDLDLVFLHDSAGARQETEGARTVDNQVYFARFVQRFVHMLDTWTAAGRLYEVDMRLRPSGRAGLLITGVESFAAYQREEALTWEHQALLHARSVAGSPSVRARFEQIRLDTLGGHIRRATLREDIRHVRQRMRTELSRAAAGEFDVKQDPGGLGDIEFLAQYWVLLWAGKYPPLALFADTIRQLESVASANLVAQSTVDVLTGAYRRYREALHHRSLAGRSARLPAVEFQRECADIVAIWNGVMED